VSLLLESLQGGAELEWPQEVVGLLEVWANGHNLVDEVLVAGDSVLSEALVDDAGVSQWDSRSANLSVSSLVDEILNGLSSWVSVSDEWLNSSDHGHGSFVDSNENGVVKLSKSQKLHDLLALWAQLVDTSGSDDNSNLGLFFNENVSSLLSSSLLIDKFSVGLFVLGSVLGSMFSSNLSLLSSIFFCLCSGLLSGLC
jgi:hypothetical protein